MYEEHQRFVMSFDPQWRSDENVMLLLSAIALFTPERSNVVHKDVVKFEQVSHLYFSLLLKRARTLKFWADVADKIYFGRNKKLRSGSGFLAVQERPFPRPASVACVFNIQQI